MRVQLRGDTQPPQPTQTQLQHSNHTLTHASVFTSFDRRTLPGPAQHPTGSICAAKRATNTLTVELMRECMPVSKL